MKNLLLQSRVVTDPIKNALIGWWKEYYFFYVKHRDLADRADFEQMMLDPGYDLSALYTADNVAYYHSGSALNWTKLALDRIVEEYFRADDDVATHLVDSMPIAAINQESFLDSAINDAAFVGTQDFDVDGADVNTTIQASEVSAAMTQWELARAHGLTDMDYEDYLATFGIKRPPAEEAHKPELIRYVRKWTYPTNTVDPTTGTPTSACSWSIAERGDKDRFFKEPGFIVGLTVTRPKVYLKNQEGSASSLLNSAMRWMPAIMRDDPYTSLIKVPATSGPLSSNTDAYWVDLKDLFLYGEQFCNFALTATDAGIVALPTAGLEKRYVASTDIDALFVNAAGGKNLVREDGVTSLTILGSLVDTTPQISRLAVR